MIDSIKKKRLTKENIFVLVQIFIFYRIVLNLIYSTEQPYQMPKDFYFALSAIWFTILVFAMRKIPLTRKKVWISLGSGTTFLIAYFLIAKINVARYGKLYFAVILIYWALCVAFIALMVDFFCSGAVKKTFAEKKTVLIIFLAIVACMFIYEGYSAIPVALPILAFLLTDITKEKWVKTVNCFAIGYYLAFAQTMTKSLIQNPDRYQNGRYLGSFLELESGGAFCGGAVVCMLYFIAMFIIAERKKWYELVAPLLLIAYPIYAVARITSRSTQVSLILVSLLFFAFIHRKKDRKTSITRAVLALSATVVIILAMYVLSISINKRVASNSDIELSYWERHLAPLTSERGRTGYFGDGSILNSIDLLSSGRLAHWVESSKQIRLLGHPFEAFYFPGYKIPTLSPHNFYIEWLIEYGIIGGCLIIVWTLYIALMSISRVLRHEKAGVMTFLWVFFSIGVFTFTCVRWKSPISFGLLFLQYALTIKNKDCGAELEHGNSITE